MSYELLCRENLRRACLTCYAYSTNLLREHIVYPQYEDTFVSTKDFLFSIALNCPSRVS